MKVICLNGPELLLILYLETVSNNIINKRKSSHYFD